MRVRNQLNILMASTLMLLSYAVKAEESHVTGGHAGSEIHLSESLGLLLRQEMHAIENGMRDLIPVISSGAWADVASIAQNISDSFIMKQKLTPDQKEELHRVLPQGFVEMDQDFHSAAGMLAHAATMKNSDVVNFYFFKLNSACVSCHTKYAGKRFPGLIDNTKESDHQH